jgi:hypothetical protein
MTRMPILNEKASFTARVLILQHPIVFMLFSDSLNLSQFWASFSLCAIGLTIIALPKLPVWKMTDSK